jgi:hypothetical protein
MKNKNNDYVKANRRGSRDAELENSTGFNGTHKIHKSKLDYDRKPKYKKDILSEEDDD